MGGLLYKDFTEIKGKGILILLAVLSLAFAVFRVVFAGTNEILELMVTDSMGRTVNLADIFLTSALGFFLIYLNYLINYTVKRICAADEKSKIRGYIFAGPLTKETYIASKYVFIGIIYSFRCMRYGALHAERFYWRGISARIFIACLIRSLWYFLASRFLLRR